MGYCGQTMFNALVNIDHLINKKARPKGLVQVGQSSTRICRQAVRRRAFRIALSR
jgi:hypothetical protein